MPFVITTPETKTITQRYLIDDETVEVSATRTIDHVNIEHIEISMPINNPTGISLRAQWSLGYMDGAVFFPTERGSVDLAGEALISAMQQPTTGSISHYADFKGALYTLLVALGYIPPGSIV